MHLQLSFCGNYSLECCFNHFQFFLEVDLVSFLESAIVLSLIFSAKINSLNKHDSLCFLALFRGFV